MDIFDNAKEKIIIIDNYAGKELLKSLKDIKKNIIIISSNVDNTLKEKYERQYTNVKFIANNTYHDRFILIDKNRLYYSVISTILQSRQYRLTSLLMYSGNLLLRLIFGIFKLFPYICTVICK